MHTIKCLLYTTRCATFAHASHLVVLTTTSLDLQPSNEVHDYTFSPKVSGVDPVTPQTFDLTVEPGDTHAPKSLADGDAITSNTAGVIGTFLITAHDAFDNRRPGGDSVTSLMTLLKWTANDLDADTPANPDKLPETGSVLDNNNGLYSVSYRITKAGVYQHSIAIANTVGAGTPVPCTATGTGTAAWREARCESASPRRHPTRGVSVRVGGRGGTHAPACRPHTP